MPDAPMLPDPWNPLLPGPRRPRVQQGTCGTTDEVAPSRARGRCRSHCLRERSAGAMNDRFHIVRRRTRRWGEWPGTVVVMDAGLSVTDRTHSLRTRCRSLTHASPWWWLDRVCRCGPSPTVARPALWTDCADVKAERWPLSRHGPPGMSSLWNRRHDPGQLPAAQRRGFGSQCERQPIPAC